MKARTILAALAVLTLPAPASAACQMITMAELPVTMSAAGPLIPVKINGQDKRFLVDSGAFYSFITPSAAGELHLTVVPTPAGYFVTGVGGLANPFQTTVKQFTLAGVPFPNALLLVVGGLGDDAAGLLGQNVLGVADVDYDLVKGVIRLMHPTGCSNNVLAYWRSPPAPYSAMAINLSDEENPHTTGTVTVNGVKFRAMFDTGASESFLNRSVAGRAGLKVSNPGVVDAGLVGGIGRKKVRTWIAPIDSIAIGDNEKIEHTQLRIAELANPDDEMIIGADFFLSHHVYVANSQHRLYFTYNGGPVFDLTVKSGSQP